MTPKKRALLVTQDIMPYTDCSEVGTHIEFLPQAMYAKGMETRIMMPRYGIINERRHRLHEVVRLSGMNIIVDDDDYPLIIKVASLPNTRMQVYFLDNEEFFRRKAAFVNEAAMPFEDNADRMVFFCKGIIEIVKKFGWPPEIIHCHGWLTSLVPFYLKTAYSNEPLFRDTKIVCSVYDEHFDEHFDGAQFFAKASINKLSVDDLYAFKSDDGEGISLLNGIMAYADGVIVGSATVEERVMEKSTDENARVLPFQSGDDYLEQYINFYSEV